MSRPLELPDPLYDALLQAAQASGTTPQDWIAAHLPTPSEEPRARQPKTLADLFAGRVGRFRSGGDAALSRDCGAKFTELLRRKRAEGHL
jgi:hypothetical protein